MLATSTIRSTSDPAIKLSYPRDRITIDVDGYPEWSLQGTTTYDLGSFILNSTGGATSVSASDTLSVSNCGVTLVSGWSRPLGIAANGLALTIPTAAWANYANLTPTYLGLVTTLEINSGNSLGISFEFETLVYQFRNTAWGTTGDSPDTDILNGWTQIDSGAYITNHGTITVYSKTFSPGSYTFDNYSAMYMFDPDRVTTIPPEGVFTPAEIFGSLSITPPVSYTAPEFNLNKRIQISVKRSFIIQTLNEVRKSIESRNNLVPFNLADLRKLDGTLRNYSISRAIASNVDSGGGGGATETESWF